MKASRCVVTRRYRNFSSYAQAPLPEPWKPCKTGDDDVYYFNFVRFPIIFRIEHIQLCVTGIGRICVGASVR